ncbi:hypothetical protein GCM10010129_82880 [Streptomyces fumigatiscleroticus]|nr:hypothetical protein GCM10010129_82880 [Streptomyces fumigatiscleroticus]
MLGDAVPEIGGIEVGDQNVGQIDQRGGHPHLPRQTNRPAAWGKRVECGNGWEGHERLRSNGVGDRDRRVMHGSGWTTTPSALTYHQASALTA